MSFVSLYGKILVEYQDSLSGYTQIGDTWFFDVTRVKPGFKMFGNLYINQIHSPFLLKPGIKSNAGILMMNDDVFNFTILKKEVYHQRFNTNTEMILQFAKNSHIEDLFVCLSTADSTK